MSENKIETQTVRTGPVQPNSTDAQKPDVFLLCWLRIFDAVKVGVQNVYVLKDALNASVSRLQHLISLKSNVKYTSYTKSQMDKISQKDIDLMVANNQLASAFDDILGQKINVNSQNSQNLTSGVSTGTNVIDQMIEQANGAMDLLKMITNLISR
ncbi:MAG: hypothetical protein WAM28_04400 [Chlamydiales bacterium]